MLALDIINLARQLGGDPSATGRWNQATLLMFTDRASKVIGRDVEFPESRITTSSTINQQEYATPAIIKVYRCYVAGQLIVPTTLQVLEGHQIQLYDQGPGFAPAGTPPIQTPGSGGPPGTAGTFTPAWNVQVPEAYPVSNFMLGSPAPDAQSWFAGSRPRFYWRGGVLGLVPAPQGVYDIVIDCLRVPDTLQAITQSTVYPDNFVDAMAWKVVELMKFSEGDEKSMEARDYAFKQYMYEMRNLRTWRKKQYLGDAPAMPKMLTNRSFYQKGNRRNGGSGSEYPG